jgi:hypothetical protein
LKFDFTPLEQEKVGRRDAVTPDGQFNETRLPRQEKGS